MSARRVVVVVPDLFFATRIATTAAELGVAVETVVPERALAHCSGAVPDLAILDLQAGDAIALARALKADPATSSIPLVGFYSHVDTALRQAAEAAGIDRVLPRSAFTVRLAAILEGEDAASG